eukprot:TRINITY_DN10454_c2_g3_i1.p1 TRINITY_DN10454_c2_g3~~TRINITY_DN10454_c2_g3_i1.p1  ORF type:complete len:426 (+),score=50.15 TRINITY_DN10454_c2_g3_i1:63-1340(+)
MENEVPEGIYSSSGTSNSNSGSFGQTDDEGSPTKTTSGKKVIDQVRMMFRSKLVTAPPKAINLTNDTLNGLTGRPSGLPLKNRDEAIRHAKEIAKLNNVAKRKMEEELRHRQDAKEQAEQIQSDWEFIIKNWSTSRDTKKTKKLWKQKIPDNIRPQLWKLAIGNDLQITPDLYEICKQRGKTCRENMAKSPTQETTDRDFIAIQSIDIDVPRTYPHVQFFQTGPLSKELHAILEAYTQYRPDIGYAQGMSYLVAMMLLHMETDSVFTAIVNLLHSSHLISFFRVIPSDLGYHIRMYDLMLATCLPAVYSHFEQNGVSPQLYIFDWFMTVFSKSLPLELARRIWDLFLLSPCWLYRSAVGIVKYHKATLLSSPFDECVKLLTNLPKDGIDEDAFMNCILSVKVNKKKFAALKKKASSMDNSLYIDA